MLIRHVVACAFAILFAWSATSEAAAHVVFHENFNGENGGYTAYGYQGSLVQFEAQVGSVDLIGTDNTLGLLGDGAFLNLNGLGGPTLGVFGSHKIPPCTYGRCSLAYTTCT